MPGQATSSLSIHLSASVSASGVPMPTKPEVAMVSPEPVVHAVLLLRTADHRWLNRLTDPQKQPGQARFLTWSDSGRLERDETKPLDYDARTRPWSIQRM